MVPAKFVDCEFVNGGIVPRWLGARDEPWLREFIAEVAAVADRSVAEAQSCIVERVGPIARRHRAGRRLVDAVWAVERSRWSTRIASPVSPRIVRKTLFPIAAIQPREVALETAAHDLGIAPAEVLASVFADRASLRRLVPPATPATTRDLVDRYNLGVVQTLLTRAVDVTATVRSNLRRVVGYAKLVGLMATFDRASEGATRMTLSGPLALFHQTLKYGRALARWFPSLVATPGWDLTANIVLRGEPVRLELDATAPLPRTHAMSRAHDSKIEAWLDADLRRAGSRWRIEREPTVIQTRGKLAFPDFALVAGDVRVLVEVVGFWTPQYLAAKAALLASTPEPMILCVDERYSGSIPSDDGARVLAFSKRIDAARLIATCDALVRRSSG